MSEVTADLRLAIADPGAILTRLPNESLTDWIARAVVASHADHEAQIRDLLEEREELLTEIRRLQGIAADVREAERTAEHWEGLWTVAIERAEAAEAQVTEKAAEIRRLRMGNHPAGRALPHLALAEALTERDAEHEGGA